MYWMGCVALLTVPGFSAIGAEVRLRLVTLGCCRYVYWSTETSKFMSGCARSTDSTEIVGILSYTYKVSNLRAEGWGNEAVDSDLRYSAC